MEREILRRALAPDPECLSLEQLGRYADGALGPDEHAAAATHVRRCLNCQAELALLEAVTSDSPRTGEADVVRHGVTRLERRAREILETDRPETSSRHRWFDVGMPPVAAVAAVLLIGIGAGSFYVLTRKTPGLPGEVTTRDEITRSLAVAVRGPVGDQVEAPRRFEWVAVDRAVRYRVRLMEVDRHELWSTVAAALEADLPSSVRESIAPGRTFIWDVTAYDAGGSTIAESGPQSFRVASRR